MVKPLVTFALLTLGAISPARAVTSDQVEAAIEQLRQNLLDAQRPGVHWEAHGRPESHIYGGVTALATFALLASGESPQRPELAKAIAWLQQAKLSGTYAVGIRSHVWATLPDTYRPWLRHDARWLMTASDAAGRYRYTYDPESWDNSATQYGVLGLWEAGKRGVQIPRGRWKMIQRHFLDVQNSDGGWHYQLADNSYGSMTCAGLTGLLVAQQVLYRKTRKPNPRIHSAIGRGLQWMDAHFDGVTNPGHGGHTYYYCYGVERVALTSGMKYFNGRDWFSSIAEGLVGIDAPRNSITDTSFALVFLARGRVPVWITKIQVPGTSAWNNRPNDLYFFTQWLSQQREGELNWQVISLDRPAEDLLTSPVAWLASDQAFKFTAEQKATLKRYLDLGGMLVVNPDNGSPHLPNAILKLVHEHYPQYRMKQMPSDHPIYSLLFKIQNVSAQRIMHLHNGARELIVMPSSDWGMVLQAADKTGRNDRFKLMANLFVLATNRGVLPNRLVPRYVKRRDRVSSGSLAIGRARYDGTWMVEPLAWEQLSNHIFNRTGLDVLVSPQQDPPSAKTNGSSDPEEDAPDTQELPEHQLVCRLEKLGQSHLPLIHLSGVEAVDLTDDQKHAIKQYVERGGTILVETVGGQGTFAIGVERQLQAVLQTPAVRLTGEDPIISGRGLPGGYDNRRVNYRRFAVLDMAVGHRPRLTAFIVNDRPAIILSQEDLILGAMGVPHWKVLGYTQQSATGLLTNLVLWARKVKNMQDPG